VIMSFRSQMAGEKLVGGPKKKVTLVFHFPISILRSKLGLGSFFFR
jgi:hypothetical protein